MSAAGPIVTPPVRYSYHVLYDKFSAEQSPPKASDTGIAGTRGRTGIRPRDPVPRRVTGDPMPMGHGVTRLLLHSQPPRDLRGDGSAGGPCSSLGCLRFVWSKKAPSIYFFEKSIGNTSGLRPHILKDYIDALLNWELFFSHVQY